MFSEASDREKDFGARADSLVQRVMQTIRRHAMLHPGDRVLVGVSSGPDSVALLHVLHESADRLGIALGVAHLDHGLRPQAAPVEEHFVRELAGRLRLACHTGKVEYAPRRGSLEEHLRELRYAFFTRTAAEHQYTKLALGHHADDNAEAVLMHILRGSGRRGLAGIPPVRSNWIIRPLIALRRSEILGYLQGRGLSYLHDSSNLDPRFQRNRIRHQLLPLLEQQHNPAVVRTLNRMAQLFREEEEWLESYLEPLLGPMIHRTDRDALELRTAALHSRAKPLQRHLIRMALRQWQGHLRRIGAEHVEAILAMVGPQPLERRRHLPLGILAEADGALLRFRRLPYARRGSDRRGGPARIAPYTYTFEGGTYPGQMHIAEADLTLGFSVSGPARVGSWQMPDERAILVDLARVRFPLTVRNFRPGDRLEPFGMSGSQKLKQLFCDRKIPRACRGRIPLLISAGTILWVVGVRRSSHAPLTAQTAGVLRVEIVDRTFAPEALDKSCEKNQRALW